MWKLYSLVLLCYFVEGREDDERKGKGESAYLATYLPFVRFSSDDPIHTLSFLPEYAQQIDENAPPSPHTDGSASFGNMGSFLPPIIAMHILAVMVCEMLCGCG